MIIKRTERQGKIASTEMKPLEENGNTRPQTFRIKDCDKKNEKQTNHSTRSAMYRVKCSIPDFNDGKITHYLHVGRLQRRDWDDNDMVDTDFFIFLNGLATKRLVTDSVGGAGSAKGCSRPWRIFDAAVAAM